MDSAAALIEAVHAGDGAAVRRALADGADPNGREPRPYNTPLLTVAAREGDVDVARLLLAAGADPNAVSGWEWTPLRAAAFYGHAEVIVLLLQYGADPNSGHERSSILDEAIGAATHRPRPAAIQILETLLRAGATVTGREEPPLVEAVARGAPVAVLRLLLAHGSDPDERRSDGTPVIVLAARRAHCSAVDALLDAGAAVGERDAVGRTALMHAVERGHEAVARTLLTHGADLAARSSDGATALLLAKGWNRARLQVMLGDNVMGAEPVEVARTIMVAKPTAFQLRGSPALFERWARIIEHAVVDLGEDEFETIVGAEADAARRFAARLTSDHVSAGSPGAWHTLDASAEEVGIVWGSLLHPTHGASMSLPGVSRIELADMFEDLVGQLRG